MNLTISLFNMNYELIMPLNFILLICTIVSVGINLILIGVSNRFSKYFPDRHSLNIQNIHHIPTSRFGGVGIIMGILAGLAFLNNSLQDNLSIILICGIPMFLIGLAEDLYSSLDASIRLLIIFALSTVIIWYTNITISRVDIIGIDWLLTIYPISFMLTIFSIAGLSNAYNIIDGLNGLSSFIALNCQLSISLLCFFCGDQELMQYVLISFFSIFGFLLLNYPFGKIFLGDSGAYLIGFLCATFTICLVERNQSISPFLALLINIYPITEVIFTIYRRLFIQKTSYSTPDLLHLHSLVFKYMRNKNHSRNNFQATLFISIPTFVITLIGLFFYESTMALIFIIAIYLFFYSILYKKLAESE